MPHNALLPLDITPKTPADRRKLVRALQVLAAEADHFDVRPGAAPDCTVIGVASEAHLEEIIDRLKREFESRQVWAGPRSCTEKH